MAAAWGAADSRDMSPTGPKTGNLGEVFDLSPADIEVPTGGQAGARRVHLDFASRRSVELSGIL